MVCTSAGGKVPHHLDRFTINKVGNLFLQEVGGDRDMALELFLGVAKQAGVEATNLISLKSQEDAQLIIRGFHEYKKEMTKIESAPITPEEEATWTSNLVSVRK